MFFIAIDMDEGSSLKNDKRVISFLQLNLVKIMSSIVLPACAYQYVHIESITIIYLYRI